MQHVENNHQIGVRQCRVPHVAGDQRRAAAQRRPTPAGNSVLQLDAMQGYILRWSRPVTRPDTRPVLLAGRDEQRPQYALAATDIDNSCAFADQSSTKQCRENRIDPELAAGKIVRMVPDRTIFPGCSEDQSPILLPFYRQISQAASQSAHSRSQAWRTSRRREVPGRLVGVLAGSFPYCA